MNASHSDQPGQVKEAQAKPNHAVVSTSSHSGTDSKLVEAAKPVTQNSGDTKPASSNVAPVPVHTTDQAQKSAPKVEVKQQQPTVPQPALITKEPVFQVVKPVETKAASLPSDLAQVPQQSPMIPSKPTNSTKVNVAGKSQISVSRPTESARTSSRPVTDSHLGAIGVAILNNSTNVGQATTTQPTPNKKVAVKGMAVYAIKTVGLYSSPNFKAINRLFRYPAQKRLCPTHVCGDRLCSFSHWQVAVPGTGCQSSKPFPWQNRLPHCKLDLCETSLLRQSSPKNQSDQPDWHPWLSRQKFDW